MYLYYLSGKIIAFFESSVLSKNKLSVKEAKARDRSSDVKSDVLPFQSHGE